MSVLYELLSISCRVYLLLKTNFEMSPFAICVFYSVTEPFFVFLNFRLRVSVTWWNDVKCHVALSSVN
jgi:hypothetical protein